MKPTLVILAAGMGSRYGGLKQIDPIGPNGSTVLDYSVFDAWRAGFGKIVFVIRKDFADTFHEKIGRRMESKIAVDYAYQEISDLPAGFDAPAERTKPWGTGHAIWSARKVVSEPFCVINADDFYGADAYRTIQSFFEKTPAKNGESLPCSLVAYPLMNTLSEHGGVSRGVLEVDENGFLRSVRETTDIRNSAGTPVAHENGTESPLDRETLVSMNFWGFQPAIFEHFEQRLKTFLESRGKEKRGEFYVADPVETAIRENVANFRVLTSRDSWFGVTYREDKERASALLQKLIANGNYPENLWE